MARKFGKKWGEILNLEFEERRGITQTQKHKNPRKDKKERSLSTKLHELHEEKEELYPRNNTDKHG